MKGLTCRLGIGGKEGHGEIINRMSAFQDSAIYCEIDRFCLKGIKKRIYNTADEHQLTAGTHGTQHIPESLIKIKGDQTLIKLECVYGNGIGQDCLLFQLGQNRFCGNRFRMDRYHIKSVSIVIGDIKRK